jgi:hypothetical protein
MRHLLVSGPSILAVATLVMVAGCIESPNTEPEKFPIVQHELLPTVGFDEGQIASGVVTGKSPDQPIAFTHKRHVQDLGLDCQYCHTEARKSQHAGVPPTQTCANCHAFVSKVIDKPEIKRVLAHCDYDPASKECQNPESIEWTKVHDLPDYVRFTHKRHVKAGVDCTECHGQVALMEGVRVEKKSHGEAAAGEHPETEVVGVMTRESTLQMGWCLDCHADHPSIQQNYCGDSASEAECDESNIRRAELKDCWTCHK